MSHHPPQKLIQEPRTIVVVVIVEALVVQPAIFNKNPEPRTKNKQPRTQNQEQTTQNQDSISKNQDPRTQNVNHQSPEPRHDHSMDTRTPNQKQSIKNIRDPSTQKPEPRNMSQDKTSTCITKNSIAKNPTRHFESILRNLSEKE